MLCRFRLASLQGLKKRFAVSGPSKPLLAVSSFSTQPESPQFKFKAKGMIGKIKELWKEYGLISVGTYVGIYATTFGGLFMVIHYDLLAASQFGLDPETVLHKLLVLVQSNETLAPYAHSMDAFAAERPWVANLVVADLVTETLEPIRIAGTVALAPVLKKLLKK